MKLVISAAVMNKLAQKHRVSRAEIEQCFENRIGGLLEDSRDDHQTDPPTLWFLADTDACRRLKVVYVQRGERVFIKTSYEANADERQIYLDEFGV
jgi:uncharacterized DUF497 family protein